MAKYVKVGGTWRTVSPDNDSVQTAYVKVGGTWLGVTNAYVKVAGTWRSIFTYSAFIVPNVVGQVLATGRANITNSGNTPGTNTILNNANGATPANNGNIATQSVAPGTYLSAQTVNLSYYVFAFITVPNIVGQTEATANSLITTNGNTVGSVLRSASGATANNHNTVASQTIPAANNYTTAQTVGYTLYNYTVPTPSAPSVTLISKSSNPAQFTFATNFGANTTSALAYWGPSGQGNQNLAGNVTINGGTVTVTGLTAGQTYSFMSYPNNTQSVNTIGNVTQGGLPSSQGTVMLDPLPAPTGGTVTLSGTGVVGTFVTASVSGFTGNPISYDVYITTTTSGTPDAGSSRVISSNGASSISFEVSSGQATNPANKFRGVATATNAGGTSSPPILSSNVITASFPAPTAPNPPSSVSGADILSPVGGRWSWTAGSGGSGSYSYFLRIYNSNGTLRTGPIGLGDQTYDYTQAGTFYATVETFDLNTGLTSTTARQSATVTFTATASDPTISVSNRYVGGSPNTWELTVNNTGGAGTFTWGLQFSNSNGGTVLSSTTGGPVNLPANGSATVTRNSNTYSWARWVNITTSPAATNGSNKSTSWE